jgi:hypothetical protein
VCVCVKTSVKKPNRRDHVEIPSRDERVTNTVVRLSNAISFGAAKDQWRARMDLRLCPIKSGGLLG